MSVIEIASARSGEIQMQVQGGHASGSIDVPGAGGYGSSLTFTLDRQEKGRPANGAS